MDRADVADNPEPIPMVPLGQDRPTSGSAEGANVVEPTPRTPPAEASQRSTAAHRADSAAVEPTPSVPQGQAGQDSSTVKEPETKYVLAGQPTGWAAMSKEVREFDEEKVKSCKEDVDTLLVFAGLFSAILSAFLVAAYPNLSPPPMAVMAYNIERIANQSVSYNFTDGKLIATTISPISPPAFIASSEDIRVNTLWFSSLILSLMTASFGMLVKQWLREFLAVENPSPQARLRIRHYREPQLRAWMVYEIVACLPLLLQLSLGLFFVGLCYFTSSIHKSVGHTTLPLVIGWALCFFGATALPIFFPRCPYRTTLLKAAIACLHRWLYHFAEQTTLSSYARKLCSFIAASWQQLIECAIRFWEVVRDDPAGFCLVLVLSPVLLLWLLVANPLLYISKLLISILHIAPVQALRRLKYTDERFLVEDPKSDVEILASVDAIQGNDELLGTTIAEALRYSRPKGDQVCNFLIQVLSHRGFTVPQSKEAIPQWLFHHFILSEMLRPQACESLIHILNDHIGTIDSYHQSISSHPSDHSDRRDTLLLVCVLWSINLSANANPQWPTIDPLITSCLQRGLERMDINPSGCQNLMACISSKNNWANAASLLRILSGGWEVTGDRIGIVEGAEYFASTWSEVLTAVRGHQHDFSWSLPDIPIDDPDIKRAWDAEFPQASVKYLCALLSSKESKLTSFPYDFDTASKVEQVLRFAILVCNFYSIPPRTAQFSQEQIRELTAPLVHIISLAMTGRNLRYIEALLSLCKENMDSEDYNPFYFCLLPVQEGFQPSVSFTGEDLSEFSLRMAIHRECHPNPLYHLGLCQTAILFLLLVHARTAGVNYCKGIFIGMANSIPGRGSLTADRELTKRIERIARQCLEIMEDEPNWQWHETIFPDKLISVLGDFIDPDLHQHPHCPRRLQELRQRQHENESLYASQSAQGIVPSQMGQSPPAAAQAGEEMGDEPETETETETGDIGGTNTGGYDGGGESSAAGALEDIDATNQENVGPSEAVGPASIGGGGVRDVTGGGGTDEEPGDVI